MSELRIRCEACDSRYPESEGKGINTTNGHLNVCRQCLDDVNRKNPELHTLRIQNDQLRHDAAHVLNELDRLRAERDELVAALTEAMRLVDGLSEQQAMADDWYIETQQRLLAFLARIWTGQTGATVIKENQ